MNALIRLARMIAALWLVASVLGVQQNVSDEIALFVFNMAGAVSIALLFGYGRGKRGLRAGWIGWTFMLVMCGVILVPSFIHSKTPVDMLIGLAIAAVFIGIGFYLPYYFGRKIGLRQFDEDGAA